MGHRGHQLVLPRLPARPKWLAKLKGASLELAVLRPHHKREILRKPVILIENMFSSSSSSKWTVELIFKASLSQHTHLASEKSMQNGCYCQWRNEGWKLCDVSLAIGRRPRPGGPGPASCEKVVAWRAINALHQHQLHSHSRVLHAWMPKQWILTQHECFSI